MQTSPAVTDEDNHGCHATWIIGLRLLARSHSQCTYESKRLMEEQGAFRSCTYPDQAREVATARYLLDRGSLLATPSSPKRWPYHRQHPLLHPRHPKSSCSFELVELSGRGSVGLGERGSERPQRRVRTVQTDPVQTPSAAENSVLFVPVHTQIRLEK
jgi:hypothetical protein